jgi:hypothetical protein
MALEGNAKDFGLSEIFQLIAIQKKSGVLTITGEDTMAIFFRDGKLISTRDRRNKTRDPLKDYLLRYGFIGRDDMNRAQQIQAETGMDLTEILIQEKYFSEDELTMIFSDQIQESIQEVLSWPKSHYKFTTAKHILHGVKSFTSLKVEGILMEAMRRIDEFPELQRIFRSEEMVVKRLPMPAENPSELDGSEEMVYDLLEGERAIHEIIYSAKLARFCTYEALKNLLEKGLLLIVKDPKPSEEVVSEKTVVHTGRRGKRVAPTLTAVILLLASFAIGEYLVPYLLSPGWSARAATLRQMQSSGPKGIPSSSLQKLKLRQLEESLHEALEEYRASKGTYPFTLDILAVRGYGSKKLIDRIYQSNIKYRTRNDGESYVIERD